MLTCVFLTIGEKEFRHTQIVRRNARDVFFSSLACLLPETRKLRVRSVCNGIILKNGSMYRNYDALRKRYSRILNYDLLKNDDFFFYINACFDFKCR